MNDFSQIAYLQKKKLSSQFGNSVTWHLNLIFIFSIDYIGRYTTESNSINCLYFSLDVVHTTEQTQSSPNFYSELQRIGLIRKIFCKLDMKLWSDILFLWYGKSLFFVLSTRNVTYEFTGYSSRAITRTFCTWGHPYTTSFQGGRKESSVH